MVVLDGFDEISARLRIDAIRGINASLSPDDGVLLTSRPDEYAAAVEDGAVLTGAAVVELTDLEDDLYVDDEAVDPPIVQLKLARRSPPRRSPPLSQGEQAPRREHHPASVDVWWTRASNLPSTVAGKSRGKKAAPCG